MYYDKDVKTTISRNLKRLVAETGKEQQEVARELGIAQSTFNTWINGVNTPRMDKVDLMCGYFGVTREAILLETSAQKGTEARLLSYFRALSDEQQQDIVDLVETWAKRKAAREGDQSEAK